MTSREPIYPTITQKAKQKIKEQKAIDNLMEQRKEIKILKKQITDILEREENQVITCQIDDMCAEACRLRDNDEWAYDYNPYTMGQIENLQYEANELLNPIWNNDVLPLFNEYDKSIITEGDIKWLRRFFDDISNIHPLNTIFY